MLVLTLLLCTACDSFFELYIQNETDELHYVRVTVNRNGYVYVHRVEPRTSGFAGQFVAPGPPEDDVYTIELLDAACIPIAEWGMPSTGGYLEVSAAPEFVPGPLEDPPSPSGTGDVGASQPPHGFEHVTVLACGAVDTLP
jgi:hypothetical protein